MNEPIDDKTLEEYLSGDSQISRRYRALDEVTVPPQLDQQVLAQARAAIAGQRSQTDELERLRQRRKRLMQWSVPAGLAASAVLVVTIVMQSGTQHEVVSMPQPRASAPVFVPDQPEASSDKDSAPMVPAQPSANDSLSVPMVAPPPAPTLQVPPAEVAVGAVRRQSEMEKVETNAKRLREETQAPSGVTAGGDLAKEGAAAAPIVVAPPASMAANLPAPQISQEVGSGGSARAIGDTAIEPKAAAPQASSRDNSSRADETTAARKQAIESRQTSSRAEDDLSEVTVTGSRVPRNARTAGPRGTVPQDAYVESQSDAAAAEPQIHEEPKPWLERIRQLRKDGKTEAADREWKRFREAYPDYSVAESDLARGKNRGR